jgi:hypothetical protein
LSKLLTKDNIFKWTEYCEEAFVKLYWDHVYQTDEVYLELWVSVGQPSIEETNV